MRQCCNIMFGCWFVLCPAGAMLFGQYPLNPQRHVIIEDSIASLQASGDVQQATRLQRPLALTYLTEQGHADRAISLLLKSIYTLESFGDSATAFRCREDLARIYMAKRYYHEALFHYAILLGYYQRHEKKIEGGVIQAAIADTYAAMDSLRSAIPYYLAVEKLNEAHSVPILSEMHDASVTALTRQGYAIAGLTDTTEVDFGGLMDNRPGFHALCLLNNGHRYFALNDLTTARYYYQQCLDETNIDEVIRKDALYKMSGIYKQMGEWKTAYDLLEHYSFINDSLINDRRQRVINKLLVSYQTYEQKSKIRELEKDQKIAAFQKRLQNVLTFSLLFGFVIVLIGAYFTIRNYQHRFNANQIIHRQTTEINRQRITELENNVKIESMNSMIQGQEAERERVAKDLHDSLGGLLSTVKLHFDALQTEDAQVSSLPEYQRAYTLLDEACKEVRHISNNLQPGALSKLGLVAAIKDLINRVRPAEGPAINFQHDGVKGISDARVSLNVYRIVQELLNNALKHSGAHEIAISLSQKEDTLSIVVEDDGKGYEPGAAKVGMGAENIASRVNYLKGDLSIHSVIGEGTTTQIDVPLTI